MTDETQRDLEGRAGPWLERSAPWLVIALHAAFVARLVSIRDLLSGRPILGGDYSFHYYQSADAAEHFRNTGALWGYDPFWMAGYPEGLIDLIDGKLFLVTLALTPASARAIVFNLLIIAMLLSVPALGYVAARLAHLRRDEATCVALAGTVTTFTVPLAVFFWGGGGISFFFASALAAPATMAVVGTIEGGRRLSVRSVSSVLAAMFAVYVHPAVLPVFAVALLPVVAAARGERSRYAARLAVVALALACALWSPITAARFADRSRSVFSFASWVTSDFLQGGWRRLWSDWVVHALHTEPGWSGGAGGLVPLGLLAVSGATVFTRRSGQSMRLTYLAPWTAAGLCFALAYGSSRFQALRVVQPYRFLLPLAFFLCLPAGQEAARLIRELRRGSVAAFVALGFVVWLIATGWPASRDAVLAAPDDEAESGIVQFLAHDAETNGRLLVESSWTALPAFAGSPTRITVKRFTLLPQKLHRECIGSSGTAHISPQRYAAFTSGTVLAHELSQLHEPQLAALLARYSISWIVACDPQTRRQFTRFAATVEGAEQVADCEIFRVREPSVSRVLEGTADVEADLDRLHVRNADGARLVLKYHWMPGLSAIPPVRLEEAPRGDAPVGFIAAYPEGQRDFVIVYGR